MSVRITMDPKIESKLISFFTNYPQLHYKKKEVIIAASEAITSIYFVQQGCVQQRLITEDAEELTLHLFKPVSFFPMMVVLGGKENEFDFVAMQSMLLHKAPVQDVLKLLHTEPEILFDLSTRFAQGLNGLVKKIATLTFADSHAKLASFLFYFANRMGKKQQGEILIPLRLTHAEIASWVGMPRETVSRHFEKFQKLGILEYKNYHIVIKDIRALQKEISKLDRVPE